MEMMYYQFPRFSYQDSLKILEADIQHANALAAAIPKAKGRARLQMKLVYNQLAPLFLFLLQWMDCSCTCLLPRYLNLFHILVYKVYTDGRPNISAHGRKATIRDFYAIILPSLRRLHDDLMELGNPKDENPGMNVIGKKKLEGGAGFSNIDLEREDECGICLEHCTKMVLPNCCHAMCINCYRDWNTRSESCPFCRGSIKRVKSRDLWVLTCSDDVVDAETVCKEDLLSFYRYISSLPKDSSEALFVMHYEYLL
ncbi:E3 ubiquitin-protein ligase AIRP2-like [Diospyros lotus]|uniref:E3 ubiquitin-protein ligase AIRP2-like n=1 Tax=Diospyros lotus TaxID=55363 RepID=UPI00225A6D0C|nr:E3 ubiquitin-protein ligase AIRP2-like [Diospyros lotus]